MTKRSLRTSRPVDNGRPAFGLLVDDDAVFVNQGKLNNVFAAAKIAAKNTGYINCGVACKDVRVNLRVCET